MLLVIVIKKILLGSLVVGEKKGPLLCYFPCNVQMVLNNWIHWIRSSMKCNRITYLFEANFIDFHLDTWDLGIHVYVCMFSLHSFKPSRQNWFLFLWVCCQFGVFSGCTILVKKAPDNFKIPFLYRLKIRIFVNQRIFEFSTTIEWTTKRMYKKKAKITLKVSHCRQKSIT